METDESKDEWIFSEDEELLASDPGRAARRRAARALHDLNLHLLTHDLPETLIERIAQEAESHVLAIGQFKEVAGRVQQVRHFPNLAQHLFRMQRELSGVLGRANAGAMVGEFRIGAGGVPEAVIYTDWLHEGPPGCLHGGLIAALFDDFLGVLQNRIGGPPGVTGTLAVRYVAPTPLHQTLVMKLIEARVEHRKKWLSAELLSEGIVTARCEALFIIKASMP